jgi:hypothetical protein
MTLASVRGTSTTGTPVRGVTVVLHAEVVLVGSRSTGALCMPLFRVPNYSDSAGCRVAVWPWLRALAPCSTRIRLLYMEFHVAVISPAATTLGALVRRNSSTTMPFSVVSPASRVRSPRGDTPTPTTRRPKSVRLRCCESSMPSGSGGSTGAVGSHRVAVVSRDVGREGGRSSVVGVVAWNEPGTIRYRTPRVAPSRSPARCLSRLS